MYVDVEAGMNTSLNEPWDTPRTENGNARIESCVAPRATDWAHDAVAQNANANN